jgi:hypothetical protein
LHNLGRPLQRRFVSIWQSTGVSNLSDISIVEVRLPLDKLPPSGIVTLFIQFDNHLLPAQWPPPQ